MCLWPCWWRMNKLRRLEAFAVSPLWSLDISWGVLYDCVKYFHYTRRVTSKQAVKWLSLISIKSEQVSKICSMVKRLSHPIHIGGSSPFNKKEWVIKEWPMYNRAITISSFLFVRGQTIHSFSIGNILYNLFSGNSSHSDCHSSNIIFICAWF